MRNTATINKTTDEMRTEYISIEYLIVSKFREIFKTNTVSAISGNCMFTITRGVNSHKNPVVTVYSFHLDSKTPYRYTDITWDASNSGEMWIGTADSISPECKELVEYINELCEGYVTHKYTTRGE